jgi:hypothetical protein
VVRLGGGSMGGPSSNPNSESRDPVLLNVIPPRSGTSLLLSLSIAIGKDGVRPSSSKPSGKDGPIIGDEKCSASNLVPSIWPPGVSTTKVL